MRFRHLISALTAGAAAAGAVAGSVPVDSVISTSRLTGGLGGEGLFDRRSDPSADDPSSRGRRATSGRGAGGLARRSAILLAAITAAIVVGPVSNALAGNGTLAGRLAGGALPASSSGTAVVRAVRLPDGVIVGAADVSRAGGWQLNVPAGFYIPTASVVSLNGLVVDAIAPVVRVRSGHTVRSRISLKRTKPHTRRSPRRSAPAVAAVAAAAAANKPLPVAVNFFSATGPKAALGRGLADVIERDLVNAEGACKQTVVEWRGRAEVLREIELSHSKYFDPSTAIPQGHMIEPRIFVTGSAATTADSMSWQIQLVDAKTGTVIGGDSGEAGLDSFVDTADGIASRLLDQLCSRSFRVTLQLDATLTARTYFGKGTVTAEVTATSTPDPHGVPPRQWSGSAPLTFANVQYGGMPGCSVSPGTASGSVQVNLKRTADGRLEVIWTPSQALGQLTISCPWGSFTGGTRIEPFLGTAPTTFTLPPDGGTQALNGTLALPGGGWQNEGTMVVAPLRPS